MANRATEIDAKIITLTLSGIPESVSIARSRVRTALGFQDLGKYADDAEIITSELVSNAVQHVRHDGTKTVGVILARTWNPEAVTIIVSDSSPQGPIMCDVSADSERGRGLRIVAALSVRWGWQPEDGGKAIFAVLAKEAST